jgi:hypothetical protein
MKGFIVLIKTGQSVYHDDDLHSVFETEQEAYEYAEECVSGTFYAIVDLSQLQFEMVI